MRLTDVIQRSVPPLPWLEGEKIPYGEINAFRSSDARLILE